MKLVIDIPEETYESIQDNDYCGISNSDMYNAIKNGTPLPKNHGRLIDADELIKMYKKDCGRRIYADNFIFDLENNTTTIIETTINSEKTTITDGDLISRDSAIELVNYALAENKDVLEVLENMPSAEPKTRRWIPIDDFPHEVWECDHCGFVIDGSGCIEPTEYRDLYSFCPNCGSKMKGE